mmetsp:Transcript_7648/g.17110  ORF Transcript_7648/g.17110 Transcript_7648/m.17110 type:complete len:141 (+) Transcript_7648:694-1116(+)
MRVELRVLIESAPLSVQAEAFSLVDQLDDEQLRAAYGLLVTQPQVGAVAGPGGTGKTALMRLLVLLEPSIALVAPTNGSRRADQQVVDEVLPPKGYRPQLQVGTTYTGFGVGFGGRWDSRVVAKAIRSKEPSKAKASGGR